MVNNTVNHPNSLHHWYLERSIRVLTAIIFSLFTQTLTQRVSSGHFSGEGSGWHIVISALLALQIYFLNFICIVLYDSKKCMLSISFPNIKVICDIES